MRLSSKTFRCWWSPGWRRCSRWSSSCTPTLSCGCSDWSITAACTEEDARARIAAQASDEQRRAVADVWLDNSGSAGELAEQARDVWNHRITPVRPQPRRRSPAHRRRRSGAGRPDLVRSGAADRGPAERPRAATGRCVSTTSGRRRCPGLDAKDVIDIQVTVESLAAADELGEPLLSAGYPRIDAHHR